MEIESSGVNREIESKAVLRQIVLEVDKALWLYSGERSLRQPLKRNGYCGFTSDLVKRAAERKGVKAQVIQVANIHEALGSSIHTSFQHGFNILDFGTKKYIVDESFCQFIDPELNNISQGRKWVSGSISDHPIAQVLLEDGFIRLTEKTFRDYLRVTSSAEDKSYIDNATLEILNNPLVNLSYDHTPEDLDAYLDGKAKIG